MFNATLEVVEIFAKSNFTHDIKTEEHGPGGYVHRLSRIFG
jgi:hypothetical protein